MATAALRHLLEGIYLCQDDDQTLLLAGQYGVLTQIRQRFEQDPTVILCKNTPEGLAIFMAFRGHTDPKQNGFQVFIAKDFAVNYVRQLPVILKMLSSFKFDKAFLTESDEISREIKSYLVNLN
ncbi:MAG: hypothetical protein KF690_11035 [Bacteroidetes bacterium]|nr:hypothetical protein [Bacteroidota bacterium]